MALPNRVQEDCKIIRRAIREGWPVPLERRQRILTTLQQIVETDTFEIEKIVHEQGPDKTSKEVKTESIKAPNHKNQIAAAKAILAAAQLDQQDAHHVEAHNQRERHHADDVARGAGENKTVHNTIILGGADASRLMNPPKREG